MVQMPYLALVALLATFLNGSGSDSGDLCSVVHYLLPEETRNFRFGSGAQFRAELECVFVFAGLAGQRLEVRTQDLRMADSCEDDLIKVYNYNSGVLNVQETLCNKSTAFTATMDANIAVITFSSRENRTDRFFMLTVTSMASNATKAP